MLIHRTEHLDSDAAADLAGELLTAALRAAQAANPQGVTLKNCGEAVGYTGEDAGNPFREHCKGTRALTLPKLLQLCAHKPSVGHHLVMGLAGWFTARLAAGAPRDRVAALDELLRAVLELASALVAARVDNAVDDDEATRLREPMARVGRALERFAATLAPAADRSRGRESSR